MATKSGISKERARRTREIETKIKVGDIVANKEEWLDINGYHIFHDKNDIYTAYDSKDREVYSVSRREDNNFVLKMNSKSNTIVSIVIDGEKPFDFEMVKPNCVLYSKAGKEITITNEVITKMVYDLESGQHFERFYNDENIVENEYNSLGELVYRETTDKHLNLQLQEDFVEKTKNYYTKQGDFYCMEFGDGRKEYNDEEDPFIIYKDGTFSYKKHKGNYTIDSNGHFICIDGDNNQIFFDTVGHKYKMIAPNGTVYNYDKNSQTTIKNGKVSYTAINHIEYDEDAYDNILNTLNGIEGYKGSVKNAYSNILNAVSNFPDTYSCHVTDVIDNVDNHITLIDSLKESINYSLLTYQACDNDLKECLDALIDDLFDESKVGLARIFKREINGSIEDRDNDNILEYKKETNFNTLTQRAIPKSYYVDKNGNKIYLSKNGKIFALDGKETQISYSNEIFNLTSDKDGVLKLTDKDGNSLNVFGDYNIDSVQYGSNQMQVEYSYNDNNIMDMLNKYYPTSTMEEKVALLSKITYKGCGYAAITNLIFKEFEGNENAFYKAYGFPMYDVRKVSEDGYFVDYNYEAVMVDLFCNTNDPNRIGNINYLIQNGSGVNKKEIERIYKYLKNTKGVTLGNKIGAEYIVTDRGYSLYADDGEKIKQAGDSVGHMMIITAYDSNGNKYVSSWGRKCIYKKSNDDEYIERFNNIWKSVMNND